MIDINAIKEEYIDQITAAKILDVTQARISQLCSQGRFDGASKIGWSWIIPKNAIDTFQRRKRGRKPQDNEDKDILKQALVEATNLNEENINEH